MSTVPGKKDVAICSLFRDEHAQMLVKAMFLSLIGCCRGA